MAWSEHQLPRVQQNLGMIEVRGFCVRGYHDSTIKWFS
jgi:hypothetical protein